MLLNYERETVINFNEEEKTANVYTYNRALKNKLDDLVGNGVELIRTCSTGAKTYVIPKKWIKISPPRKLNLTEEQRKEIGVRLKKASK